MRGQIRSCVVSFFTGPLTARVTAFADDMTVFIFRHLDIKAVKKAVSEYERIAGAKVNFDKSKGLLLEPSVGVTNPSAFLGCGSGPTSNWSEISRRYKQR